MSASTCRPSASRTSPSTTLAPSWANRRASTAPMPRAPPLIKATFPANRITSLRSSVLVLRTTRGEGIVGEAWAQDKRPGMFSQIVKVRKASRGRSAAHARFASVINPSFDRRLGAGNQEQRGKEQSNRSETDASVVVTSLQQLL